MLSARSCIHVQGEEGREWKIWNLNEQFILYYCSELQQTVLDATWLGNNRGWVSSKHKGESVRHPSIPAAERQQRVAGSPERGQNEEDQFWHHGWNASRVPAVSLALSCYQAARESYIRTWERTEGKSILFLVSQCFTEAAASTATRRPGLVDKGRLAWWKRSPSTPRTRGCSDLIRRLALRLLGTPQSG